MRQALAELTFRTPGRGFTEITREIAQWIDDSGITEGLVTLHCQHTSALLTITENASPAVLRDLQHWLDRIAPERDGYEHDDEGPDDMPAHIRAALTQTQLSIPVSNGRMVLGTWQSVYVFEHRDRPHHREVSLHVIGA